jgi:hypothetical protein
MSDARVTLHVGESNSGMGLVQQSLWANRDALHDRGVAVPGQRRRDVADAARSLVRWTPDSALPDPWRRLVDSVGATKADSAVICHETLSRLDDDQVSALAGSFSDLAVVITVSDLARLVVAEWQSALRQGRAWTLTEYAAAVAGDEDEPAWSHFWRRHDHAALVDRWSNVAMVSVVTTPRAGDAPDLLWSRFCEAAGLPGDLPVAHEAAETLLDGASAEVLRRLNQTGAVNDLSRDEYARDVGVGLVRRVMAKPADRAPVAVPPEVSEWAAGRSAHVVEALAGSEVRVVGTLDDLVPTPTPPGGDPEPLSDDVLLDAAMDALAGYAAEYGRRRADRLGKRT